MLFCFGFVDVQPLVEYVVNCPVPDGTVLEELWSVERFCLDVLMNKPKDFWIKKLQDYFLISKPVQVMQNISLGRPSFFGLCWMNHPDLL